MRARDRWLAWAGLGLALGCSRAPSAAPARESPTPVLAGTPAPRDDASIHGELSIHGGHTVLRVWGTPRQMGHAHGALLREAILDVVDHYALEVVPPATLAAAGAVLAEVGSIAAPLREEAQGIVDGMIASGGAHVPSLGRALNADDLLALNAMTDLVAMGCSSLSSWGDGVATDRDGAPMVVRNLDWTTDADLLEHQIILVTMPADPARQPVVSVGFAGYIACLSCINEAGVTALFNMGYGQGAASLGSAVGGFAPANLLLRDALERRDVDGDGHSRAADLERAITTATHVGSYIVHVVEPRHGDGIAPARVLEVEADGVAVRTPGERPRDALGGERLAATNHLREKTPPSACSRYRRIEQRSTETARFDAASLWALGRALRLDEVVHTMLVEPESRALTLWLRRPGESAQAEAAGVRHGWDTLLGR